MSVFKAILNLIRVTLVFTGIGNALGTLKRNDFHQTSLDLDVKIKSKFDDMIAQTELKRVLRDSDKKKGTEKPSGESNNNTSVQIMPYPVQLPPPIYQIPQVPIVVPAQTIFEPVIHDHPPLHMMEKLMKKDARKHKRRQRHSYETDSDTSSSWDSSSDADYSSAWESSNIDYYGDVFHVKGS